MAPTSTSLTRAERLLLVAAFVTHGLLVFVTLPNASFNHQDESLYFSSTRQMHQDGDFLVPRYDGTDRIEKPILFYWMMVASQLTFGESFWSSRLVSLLASLALLGVSWQLSGFFLKEARHRVAVVWMLGAADIFYRYSHYAVPEITLTLTMTTAHLFFLQYDRARSAGESGRRHLYLFYAMLGLGFLIKGPVAILLPLACSCLYYLAHRRPGDAARLLSPVGFLLIILMAIPWYLMLGATLGWKPVLSMIHDETVARLGRERGGIFYFVPILFVYYLPWTAFLGVPLADLITRQYSREAIGRFLRSYPFIWFSLYFVFYSAIVGERHQWYALGWSVPLILMIAQSIAPPRTGPGAQLVFSVYRTLALVGAGVCWVPYFLVGPTLASPASFVTLTVALIASAVVLTVLIRRQTDLLPQVVALGATVMVCHWIVFQLFYATTWFIPALRFPQYVQKQTDPFHLLIQERYLKKKLQLFNLPNLQELSYEKEEGDFLRIWQERLPDYVFCRAHLYGQMPDTLQPLYEVALCGYIRQDKERRGDLDNWLEFFKTRNLELIVDRMVLLEKRREPSPISINIGDPAATRRPLEQSDEQSSHAGPPSTTMAPRSSPPAREGQR